MSFVSKWKSKSKGLGGVADNRELSALVDGSIDSLDCILRTMGEFAFELEDEDPRFRDLCKQYARHVSTGAAIDDEGIAEAGASDRQWARVRRFYVDRRQREEEFVNDRLRNYRILVEDLVCGFKSLASAGDTTRTTVGHGLQDLERAVEEGSMRDIRAALADSMATITAAFRDQRRLFDEQLGQLNRRMLKLRHDLAEVRDQLQRDPLTDAFNRDAFDITLQQHVSLNFILRQPLCVALVDIDELTIINEEFGTAARDDVLRAVADCLSRAFVRRSDFVARYSACEFVVILGDTDEPNGIRLMDRFLDMVRESVRIPYAPADRVVTCSAGLTEMAPSDTVDTLLQRIARGSLRARRDGGNRVETEPLFAAEA
jgi:diguanylate cyclase (GGDEF)-like protein